MGKEMQVSLGVIGVLLIMFLAMVYHRLHGDDRNGIPAQIQNVDDGGDTPRAKSQPTVKSQPTIVGDNPLDDSADNPRQGARNPRNTTSPDQPSRPVPSHDSDSGFTPVPYVQR